MSPPTRRAAFLDRDGTLVRDTHYLSRPEDVELLPGAAEAVRRLNQARVPAVVITNQSGIARGYFDLDAYERVRARLDEMLAARGAHLDATFMCPHHPDFDGECECRKPGTLLYRQAAAGLDLDLARSWYVGDKWRDVEPAIAFGGRGILVPGIETPAADERLAHERATVARTIADAVDAILDDAGFTARPRPDSFGT